MIERIGRYTHVYEIAGADLRLMRPPGGAAMAASVTTLRLSIEPELCGPVSVGTARVIKLVIEHLGVSLSEAMASVDRCVFDGEEVELVAPSAEAATRLEAALAELPAHPRVRAEICA